MKNLIYFFFAFLTLGIFLGFSNNGNSNALTKSSLTNKNNTPILTDYSNNQISTGVDYYSSDNFTETKRMTLLK